jgi:hypothetical protein
MAITWAGAIDSSSATPAAPQRNNAHLALSPVVICERPDVIQGYNVDAAQVKQMVNHALMVLASASDVGTAWTRLGITPQDTVGIKISTAGGKYFSTHQAVVKAICDGLQAAGVPSSQIIIWDKFQDKMAAAGYPVRAAGNGQVAIQSMVPSNAYDPSVFYKDGVIGNLIWGDYMFNQMIDSDFYDSSPVITRSYYAKYLTQTCTKIVNVPVLNYNEMYGIDGCMTSLALGATDNNRRFIGAPTYGDPSIDMIYDQRFIRRKVVVQILDALVGQCAGGPTFNPLFCQSFGAIYVGRDPVAIDSLALPRLDRMRRNINVPSVGNTSTYLTSASVLGLGTTDRHRIQFLRVP